MSTKSNENMNESMNEGMGGDSKVSAAAFGCACGPATDDGQPSGGCSIKRTLTSALYYTVVLLGLGAAALSIWG